MPTTTSAADLARVEQSLYKAMFSGDNKALDALLSDKLRYIHSNGRVQSKAEVLKDFAAPQDKSVTTSETVSEVYPGVGVVSTVTTTKTDGGKPSEKVVTMRTAYVWVEEAQGWRLILRQTSRIPDAK